jgi:conjugative transfer region lipoprotein (TIGR03751 family)
MNIKIAQVIPVSLISLTVLMGSGCSSVTTAELPQDGPKMQTVYENHFEESGAQEVEGAREQLGTQVGRTIHNGDADLSGYTRTAHNEINELFPRLPNPTLIMYIDPHLTEAGNPVPGYSTAFPMYKVDQYALPGEAPIR